jgi:Tfp pilus assembly protein PilX
MDVGMTRRHLRPAHKDPARRVDRAHDDRGSIVLVLLIIIASSILVLTVAGIAISQQVVAEHTVQRNDALEAAEAGLDAAVGELRVANNGAGNGEVEDLPCTGSDNFSLTGYLGGTSTATYTVTVTYYQSVEPTNTNIANGAAQPVSCYTAVTPGYPDAVPYYAVIESVGQDPNVGPIMAPSRTIQEIYAFHDTNLNVADGVIEDFNYAVDDLCIADLTAWNNNTSPAVGDSLGVEKCATAGDPDQTWQYEQNFTLEFTSTVTTSTPLCVQNNLTNDTISLQKCANPVTTNQQWGINDSGEYEPVSSSGGAASQNVCINEESNSAGATLNLATCSGGFSDEQTWQPTPAVGSGDAGTATQQFVNYLEFGNCMDVTNQSVSYSYLIDYMCKQFPDGAAWTPQSGTNPYDPTWNQRWSQLDVTYAGNSNSYVELQTNNQPANNPNTLYCLYSPDNITDGTTDPSGSNPSWVIVKQCPSLQSGNKVPTGDQGFLWNVNNSTSYNVTDFWNECMTADTADQQVPGGGSSFSTITVAQCSSSAAQEWNAPASLSSSGVSNMYEPSVSGN